MPSSPAPTRSRIEPPGRAVLQPCWTQSGLPSAESPRSRPRGVTSPRQSPTAASASAARCRRTGVRRCRTIRLAPTRARTRPALPPRRRPPGARPRRARPLRHDRPGRASAGHHRRTHSHDRAIAVCVERATVGARHKSNEVPFLVQRHRFQVEQPGRAGARAIDPPVRAEVVSVEFYVGVEQHEVIAV